MAKNQNQIWEHTMSYIDSQKQKSDYKNGQDFFEWDVDFNIVRRKDKDYITYAGKILPIPVTIETAKGMRDILKAFIVERSVCEARMHLASICKFNVKSRGITPTYGGPDIEFNPSLFKFSIDVIPYEELIPWQDMNKRQTAEILTDFVNQLPDKYVIDWRVISWRYKRLK